MSSTSNQPPGARGFGADYWSEVYSTPGHVDGVGNAQAHADYLRALFFLDTAYVGSIADFGFGLGHLLRAVTDVFSPQRVLGIEPSRYAFEQLSKADLHTTDRQVRLLQTDLLSWCLQPDDGFSFFDLGLCSSVLQYLSDDELTQVVPILAKRLKWLYLTVPTDDSYAAMNAQSGFSDRFATPRSAQTYHALLRPHFDIVSSRLLESKRFARGGDSPFSEALFRC